MERAAQIMDFVKKELLRGRKADLRPEDDLLNSGILDSLSILQLVTFVEKHFGIQVPDEDVVYENFHSIAALSNYLNGLQAGTAAQ